MRRTTRIVVKLPRLLPERAVNLSLSTRRTVTLTIRGNEALRYMGVDLSDDEANEIDALLPEGVRLYRGPSTRYIPLTTGREARIVVDRGIASAYQGSFASAAEADEARALLVAEGLVVRW